MGPAIGEACMPHPVRDQGTGAMVVALEEAGTTGRETTALRENDPGS